MTGRQKSKLTMFQAVERACLQFRYVWNQLPAFQKAFDDFQNQLKSLGELAKTQRRHTGGASQEKVRVREELCALAFEIAAAVRANALASGDTKVAGKLAFSLTTLRIGKDQLCLERCRQILAAAEHQQTQLENFGITERRLEELSSSLEAFALAAEQTKSVRSANKALTGKLPAAFSAVEQVLYNQLDNLIPQFRATAPRFYNQFQESRVMRRAPQEIAPVFVTETEEPQLLD
jgi:hypothetical protein